MKENIVYRVEQAEESSLENHSVDLVTIAQALHWFRWDEFYSEVNRVMKPGGIIGIIAYDLPVIHPDVDREILFFHDHTIGKFWDQGRAHMRDRYARIPFPFPLISTPSFFMEINMTRENLLNYIGTWSALNKFKQEMGYDAMTDFANRITKAWPGDTEKLMVRWNLLVMAGIVGS